MRILLFTLLVLLMTDGARRANDAYQRGDYATAESAYREAIRENPDDIRLHFNLGNALARQGKFDEAIVAFERFRDLSDDPAHKAMADYNIGNIYGNLERWDKAADQFRSSLRQNPEDAEAKHNFELANRFLQEQQQQPQPSQDQQQDGESEGDQNQSQSSSQDQDSQDGQSNNDPNQDQPRESADGQPQPDQRRSEMSREEADRILNALENKEQDLLKDYQKKQVPPTARHVRNW